MVYKTERVTKNELNALQNYLNNGGIVISDSESLKHNEYGQNLEALKQSKGQLIIIDSMEAMKTKAFEILESKNQLPEVSITEVNTGTVQKGCTWRIIKNNQGNNVVSIINLGKTTANLNIKLKNKKEINCKDLLKGINISSKPTLKPYEVLFFEVLE